MTAKKVDMEKLYSPAVRVGSLLAKTFEEDPHFYFFSPDETTSNKFDKIFKVEKRAWGLPYDEEDVPSGEDGRIVEMLSENVLFSVMTGHLMSGEKAMMGSYEAFFPIITSQILQQMKFIKQSKACAWRDDLPAVNLLSTSTCWRQDHNGFTHQSPAMISTLLAVPSNLANCYFPIDDVVAEVVYKEMLASKNVVNLTTFNKNPAPRFMNSEAAERQLAEGGAIILDEYSDEDPDFVLTAAGDLVSREMLLAMEILREDVPGLRLRLVSVGALSYRAIGTTDNKLSKSHFDTLFTKDKPILGIFHGYPETFQTILESYTDRKRMRIHGFNEEGSTTTPFEMLRRNAASRYDLAIDVARVLKRNDLVEKYSKIMTDNHTYALRFGKDML